MNDSKSLQLNYNIVRKGVSTPPLPPFQNNPPITRIPHPPTLPANPSSQVYLINKNGFFNFKFTLKYMLGIIYIIKIHARKCLYISLYSREGFSHPFNLLYPKASFTYNFKTYRKKRFFNGATSNRFL